MKRTVIYFIVLSLLQAPLCFAQKENILVGLRGGVYFSRFQINSQYNATFNGDDAVYGGIQVQIPVSKKLFITPEVLYAISSVTLHDGLTQTIFVFDDISKILIPVQVKYQLGHFGFYAGMQTEILAKATNTIIRVTKDKDVRDSSYKKTDFSAVFGFEYAFNYRFGIDMRYHHTLGNMRASNGSTPITDNGAVKMNAFETGLFFRFGKKPSQK